MPIFEYCCESCGAEFEKLLFRPRPSVSCTSCGSDSVKRKPSLFGTSGTEKKVSSGGSCSSCSASSCAGCASH